MIQQLLQADKQLFYFFNGLLGRNSFFDLLVQVIGEYVVYLVPVLLLIAWFVYKTDKYRIDMLKATLASVFIWQVPTRIISWFWYRPRPFVELANTKELFFHVPSYSFPSDHSTFIAALATYFYLLGYKKLGGYIFLTAFLVGLARIVSGMHYPLDVLAGWLLGVLGSYLLFYLDKYLEKYLAKPLLSLAKKIKLA